MKDYIPHSVLRNVRTCLEHSAGADLVLEMEGDGEFRCITEG